MTLLHIAFDLVGAAAIAYTVVDRLPTKEVDKITAGLKRVEKRLAAAVDHHLGMADLHQSVAADAQAASIRSRDEAAKAARVADKVGSLLA